jgi:phage N-6-adenine-methyltransferase
MSKLNGGMFSSDYDAWETPQEFFDKLDKEFHFTLDVCATDDNHKCDVYFTKEDDGLSQEWSGVCWMNPPYGKEIRHWIKKASEADCTVVCLLPARTDTSYWHDYVIPKASEIRFVRGRLKFSGAGPAPFPSAVVIYKK